MSDLPISLCVCALRAWRALRVAARFAGAGETMHLKEIVLDGFKSYAVRTVVSGFDREFNAITGLNGSGKSNVLDSICFVLGISNLTQVRVTAAALARRTLPSLLLPETCPPPAGLETAQAPDDCGAISRAGPRRQPARACVQAGASGCAEGERVAYLRQ